MANQPKASSAKGKGAKAAKQAYVSNGGTPKQKAAAAGRAAHRARMGN